MTTTTTITQHTLSMKKQSLGNLPGQAEDLRKVLCSTVIIIVIVIVLIVTAVVVIVVIVIVVIVVVIVATVDGNF